MCFTCGAVPAGVACRAVTSVATEMVKTGRAVPTCPGAGTLVQVCDKKMLLSSYGNVALVQDKSQRHSLDGTATKTRTTATTITTTTTTTTTTAAATGVAVWERSSVVM